MSTDNGKPLALITGASSGIGYELAAQFAAHGFDLLIVSEDDGKQNAAQKLSAGGARVESFRADLATYDGVESLWARIESLGRPVDSAALNAGVGVTGAFAQSDLGAQLNLIRLNVESPVHLAHRLLQGMTARRHGRILFTASIAATMPGPFEATYNASKSFLKSFAEAIRNELQGSGVTITTLMPGVTDTNFFHRAGAEDTKLGTSEKDDPADVARDGFEALMAGKDHVVAGSFMNKVQATLAHVIPDTAAAALHRKKSEPGSANQ